MRTPPRQALGLSAAHVAAAYILEPRLRAALAEEAAFAPPSGPSQAVVEAVLEEPSCAAGARGRTLL